MPHICAPGYLGCAEGCFGGVSETCACPFPFLSPPRCSHQNQVLLWEGPVCSPQEGAACCRRSWQWQIHGGLEELPSPGTNLFSLFEYVTSTEPKPWSFFCSCLVFQRQKEPLETELRGGDAGQLGFNVQRFGTYCWPAKEIVSCGRVPWEGCAERAKSLPFGPLLVLGFFDPRGWTWWETSSLKINKPWTSNLTYWITEAGPASEVVPWERALTTKLNSFLVKWSASLTMFKELKQIFI